MSFFVYLVYVFHNLKFRNKCLIFIVKMRHMPHSYKTKLYVFEFVILGEAHASPYLIYANFFLKLVLRGDAHALPLSNKIICFEFVCFWGEAHVSPFFTYLNFSLSLCLEVRHMPHLYQTKFYILNLYFWGEAHVSLFLTYLKFFP